MKTFVTSINKDLYKSYGKKFIEGWSINAHADTSLVVCFEGDIPEEVLRHNKENILITGIESDKQKKFLAKFGKLIEARGIKFSVNPMDAKSLRYSYNYRYDAIRFSFKIFAFIRCIELGLIVNDFAWIDADVVCLKKFNSNDMNIFFPNEDQLASYLGRSNFPQPNPYSECGFVGYNYSHPLCLEFIHEMHKLYENGDIFELKEWHDCMVFDHIRSIKQSLGVQFKNLSAEFSDADHPFSVTGLSEYFDHLKGPKRKKIGHS